MLCDRTEPMKLPASEVLAIMSTTLEVLELRRLLWVNRVIVVRVLLQLPLAPLTRVLRLLPLPRVVLSSEVVVLVLLRVAVVLVPVRAIPLRVVMTPPPARLLNLTTPLVSLASVLVSRRPSRVLCRMDVVRRSRVPIKPEQAPVCVGRIGSVSSLVMYTVSVVYVVNIGSTAPVPATQTSLAVTDYITIRELGNVICSERDMLHV